MSVALQGLLQSPRGLETLEQDLLSRVLFGCEEHLEFWSHLGQGYHEGAQRLLQTASDRSVLLEFICFVLDQVADVHLKLEVADHGHETILFLVKAEDVLLQVEAELELLASLLDRKHVLLDVVLVVEVEHALDPLVEDFLLLLREARVELVARLAQLATFLLLLPVVAKDLANLVLIELQLGQKLVHPDDFLGDFGDIASHVKSFVHTLLVQKLFL